jgi:electron transfer flavoprotein alpha subunit
MAKNILVVGEIKDGALRKPGLEALAAARGLAAQSGASAAAVVLGAGAEAAAGVLAAHGATTAYAAGHASYATFSSEGYTEAIVRLVRERDFGIVLFSDTSMGKDLAPAVAARLDAALVTDVVQLEMGDGGFLRVVHPIFTGKVNGEYVLQNRAVQVVSIRPNIFPAAGRDGQPGTVEKLAYEVQKPPRAVVKEVVKTSGGRVELTEADIVVAGGRSLKSAENFQLLEALADLLGAAVGASRAAVDAGYQPHSRQVGQTGKVVNPTLYIACGISGAIQHLVGMRTSKVIVAINKDASAPIFQNADYGIVGDLFEVVPALTEELKPLLGRG